MGTGLHSGMELSIPRTCGPIPISIHALRCANLHLHLNSKLHVPPIYPFNHLILSHIPSFFARLTSAYIRLAHILDLHITATPRPQIPPQRPPKQLLEHLEAHARQRRVVPPLGQLIPDERVLRPRVLVEAEGHARVVQRLADERAALGGDLHHEHIRQRTSPRYKSMRGKG